MEENGKPKPEYTQTPGRGLMTQTAYELRMNYLNSLVDNLQNTLKSDTILLSQIQNNIESYVGTIEIPLGHVGPLLFVDKNEEPEWVHTAVGTTEGALVASMNRGAKAISQSGGFQAHIVHQKMLRTPMFTFSTMARAVAFDHWIKEHFSTIKDITKKYSNHAELIEISSIIIGKIAHLKFIYNTSDASGQNMTTSCTWNACLWIEEHFEQQTGIEILHFVIDGNGASDKKVSYYAMQNGRGTHVISECFLSNEIIERTLRTNASDMFRSFNHSAAISRLDGMMGYNINVANAIAGIFASTGQDLASIHESSTGILQMEQTIEGLYLSLTLPNLVIGTVGGGTHLPVPTAILNLMQCKGAGKVERFAKLIAGFSLCIEISTLAAIVSGQFARSHQKLGRNKPVSWLLRSEVNADFLRKNLAYFTPKIKEIQLEKLDKLDNGILTQLTSKVSKKLIGFIPINLETEEGTLPLLIKSKALGEEVVDGLHFLASNISVELADRINQFKNKTEYTQSHSTEIHVNEALHAISYPFMPRLYGTLQNGEREIFLLFTELLKGENLILFNSENTPQIWTLGYKKACIDAIHKVHKSFLESKAETVKTNTFHPTEAIVLYQTFVAVNRKDYEYLDMDTAFLEMATWLADWQAEGIQYTTKLTLIHNDFNPRNIAIRKDETPCIYDWELAIYGAPHRDIFEFLAFTLTEDFTLEDLSAILRYHFKLSTGINSNAYTWTHYINDFETAGKVFVLTRVNFYLSGNTLVNYSFTERVFKVSHTILHSIPELFTNIG